MGANDKPAYDMSDINSVQLFPFLLPLGWLKKLHQLNLLKGTKPPTFSIGFSLDNLLPFKISKMIENCMRGYFYLFANL